MIHPIKSNPVNSNYNFFGADQICVYHSNSVWHITEDCLIIKHKIQDIIDGNVVTLKIASHNVDNKDLPNHRGYTIIMI